MACTQEHMVGTTYYIVICHSDFLALGYGNIGGSIIR